MKICMDYGLLYCVWWLRKLNIIYFETFIIEEELWFRLKSQIKVGIILLKTLNGALIFVAPFGILFYSKK